MNPLSSILIMALCLGSCGIRAQAVRMDGNQAGYVVRSPDGEGGAAWTYHGNDGSSVNGYSTRDSITVNPQSYQSGWYDTLHHGDQGAATTAPHPTPATILPQNDSAFLTPAQPPQYYPMPIPLPVPVSRLEQPHYNYKTQYLKLLGTLTPERELQFRKEERADFNAHPGDMTEARSMLAYLRLWIRTHPTPTP